MDLLNIGAYIYCVIVQCGCFYIWHKVLQFKKAEDEEIYTILRKRFTLEDFEAHGKAAFQAGRDVSAGYGSTYEDWRRSHIKIIGSIWETHRLTDKEIKSVKSSIERYEGC